MKSGVDTRAAIRRASLLLTIGVCVLGTDCGTPTIWKAESRSPDGLWIASAQTLQNGGFGTASLDTVVYLKQTNRSEPPVEVLGLSCRGPAPRPYVLDQANAGGTINLTMKWVTPSHLEVTYDSHPDLDFQVLKFGGIDISARDLSSETAFASLAFGQTATTPDISGTWKLNLAKSTLPKKPPTRPETITVTADGDTIQFHHSGDPKGRLPTFIVDSKEHPIEIWAEDSEQHFVKAAWEKSTLVIQFVKTLAPGHSVAYYSERWSLSSDGKTLTKEVPGTVKELYVYDKQ